MEITTELHRPHCTTESTPRTGLLHNRFNAADIIGPDKLREAQRQLEGIETGKDAIVLVLLPTIASFGSSWATTAANLDWALRPAQIVYGCAGVYLFLSFLSGCFYFRYRGWRAFLRLISQIIASISSRPVLQTLELAQRDTDVECLDLTELKRAADELSGLLKDDGKIAAESAVVCFQTQCGLAVFACAFFVAWLFLK